MPLPWLRLFVEAVVAVVAAVLLYALVWMRAGPATLRPEAPTLVSVGGLSPALSGLRGGVVSGVAVVLLATRRRKSQ